MQLSNFGPQLSQQQLTALEALVKGATVTDAAKLAGVHRSTVHNWCTDLAGFTAALRHSRIQTVQAIEDGLQSMATLALDTIRHLLESEKTPPSIRLKAAQSILAAVKDLSLPPRMSECDQIENQMRTALEDSAMAEALTGRETAPEPAAQEAIAAAVRHNSTLSAPPPVYKSVLPPLQRLSPRFNLASPGEEAA